MDFYYYDDIYGPFRPSPEQVRDRLYYGAEPIGAMLRRRLNSAFLAFFEEADYAFRWFCWLARRAWLRVREMSGVREQSCRRSLLHSWEPPPLSLFERVSRSLLRHWIRFRTNLNVAQAVDRARQAVMPGLPRAPQSMA